MTLYWAYGSNLNVAAMKARCPGAQKFAPLFVPDGALVFRGVADVVLREGGEVPGGLWWITAANERTLDVYEGVRAGFYLKRYMKLKIKNKKRGGKPEVHRCLFYQMSISQGIYPPSEGYLDCIAEGYRDFGLPLSALDAALMAAWEEKKPTRRLIERHKRRGGELARVLEVEE